VSTARKQSRGLLKTLAEMLRLPEKLGSSLANGSGT